MKYESTTSIEAVHEYLRGAGIVAFDFETSPTDAYRDEPRAALDAHKSEITGVSLSVAEGSALYIPLRHRQGVNAAPLEAMEYLRDALFENTDVVKVAHNLAFESMFLYAQGIVVQPPCYDTIAAAQLTLKDKYKFRTLSDSGLKKLAQELFDETLPSFEAVTSGRHFDELDPQDAETVRYACADSDFALRLYHLCNDWFHKYMPRHQRIVELVESPTAVYTGLMKFNGVLMDTALMHKRMDEAERRLAALRAEIADIIGDVNIGANASTVAFKRYLYSDLGLPVLKTTDKQKEAADDESMILLAEWCEGNRPELVPIFEKVQAYRKWGKLSATYITGYLKHINAATGRIHPDLLPLGTETGRFASRNVNLQNCPRKDNDPVGVRRFIIAPPAHVLLSLDFSQIELRVGAYFCRDDKMLETYRTGGDIHARTTAVIFDIPFEQAVNKHAPDYKERRTIAKNVNFGVFYGLYARGLQRTLRFKAGLDTSLEECEQIITSLRTGYPMLAYWQKSAVERAAACHYSETMLGRRRYLPDIVSEDWGKRSYSERCALNGPVQGTAAEILKLALGRIVEGLPTRKWLRPLLQVHDELIFELPEPRLKEAVAFIKGCMEKHPWPGFDVPIVAEAAYGFNFGDMNEWED